MGKTDLVPRLPSGRTVAVAFLLAVMAFGLLGMNVRPAHAVSLYSISQTKTGFVASDPLNAQLSQAQLATSSFWTFGGDAVAEGAPYAFNESPSGLNIGVQATAAFPYAGFYALHIANAVLAHAVMTSPSRTVPKGYPNVGLYVQTGGTNVDYIVCGATTSSAGTYWGVALAVGSPTMAFQYVPLYLDSSSNQPLTRNCTVMTNGQNYLAVYLDNSQVYQSSSLNLGYQMPFQFFLETQTSYQGGMFTGTFQNFYLTSGDSVTLTNMPSGSTAEIVSPSGQTLASAPADSSGTATMPIGQFNMPLVANIEVMLMGLPVASTSSPIPIWGGDAYSLSALGLGGLATSPIPAATTGASAGGATQATASPLLAFSLMAAGLVIRPRSRDLEIRTARDRKSPPVWQEGSN